LTQSCFQQKRTKTSKGQSKSLDTISVAAPHCNRNTKERDHDLVEITSKVSEFRFAVISSSGASKQQLVAPQALSSHHHAHWIQQFKSLWT
jgi:hypothetical protein